MKNLQMSVFHNDGKLIAVHKIEHCDVVKSNSIFYMQYSIGSGTSKSVHNYSELSVIRVTDTLHSMELINGKIILRYLKGYIEIVRY